MKTKRLVLFVGLLTFGMWMPNACSKDDTTLANTPQPQETTAGGEAAGTLAVKFDYTHYPTLATGQYAIWIEDADGRLVRTVFVTRFTGCGGYNNRPDCCPTWVSKANPQSHNSDEVDGYTGATPQNGRQQYVWDGKDDSGNVVTSGTYRVCIEGTLYWSSRVLFQGAFELGGESAQVTLTQENTSDEQTNRNMLSAVTAEYVAGGTPSGICSAARDNRQTAVAHDLQGRRVGKAVKSGVYIENGKKIFIKNR
jgi:hypothetical protein